MVPGGGGGGRAIPENLDSWMNSDNINYWYQLPDLTNTMAKW